MNTTVKLIENYGQLKTGTEYSVIDEGYDWVRVRNQGYPIYVPKDRIATGNEYEERE